MPIWMRYLSPGLSHQVLFDTPNDGGGGGGNQGDTPAGGTQNNQGGGTQSGTEASYAHLPPKARNGFASALARHGGNATALAAELFMDNHHHRAARRQAEEKLPKQGDMILTAADAAKWEAYKKLGTPEQLTTERNEAEQLKTRLAEADRAAVVAEAAEYLQWNKAVLTDRLKLSGVSVIIKEVTPQDGGEKEKVPYVTVSTQENGQTKVTEHPLDEYANNNWKDYLPALTQGAESGNRQREQRVTGTVYPDQTRRGSNRGGQQQQPLASSVLGSKYSRPKANA